MSTPNFNKKQGISLPPPWTHTIPEAEYHEQARSGIAVTSSMLKQFRTCPALYNAIVRGTEKVEDKASFRVGRAVHKLILEGEDACQAEFIVGGPCNEHTGRSYTHGSKAFARWAEDWAIPPSKVLTPVEARTLGRMRDALRAHGEASALLSDGWAERCAEAEIAGVLCRSRFDWLRRDGAIIDLKTTSDLVRFESDARRFGYLNQFALYREVALAAGAKTADMAAVVLEKRAPFRVGVWRFSADVLAPYAAQNLTALKSLSRCRAEDRWPTGYEGSRSFPPAGLPPLWLN